jgi:hypothetical protein
VEHAALRLQRGCATAAETLRAMCEDGASPASERGETAKAIVAGRQARGRSHTARGNSACMRSSQSLRSQRGRVISFVGNRRPSGSTRGVIFAYQTFPITTHG